MIADPHRDDDELRILRWLVSNGPAKLGELRATFAARMGHRVRLVVERLRERLEVELVAGRHQATEAGRARTRAPRPRLPVLPTHVTPQAGFTCTRLGTSLKVQQCASRYKLRGDDACGRDADGRPTSAGCPVGAEATRSLATCVARNEPAANSPVAARETQQDRALVREKRLRALLARGPADAPEIHRAVAAELLYPNATRWLRRLRAEGCIVRITRGDRVFYALPARQKAAA